MSLNNQKGGVATYGDEDVGRSRFWAKVQECRLGHLKCKAPIRHPSQSVEEAVGVRGLEFGERCELEGPIWERSASIWNLKEGGESPQTKSNTHFNNSWH